MKTKLLKKLRKKAKKKIGIAYYYSKYLVGKRTSVEKGKLDYCTIKDSLDEAENHLNILRRSWIESIIDAMKCERNEKIINKKLRKI